MRSDGAPLLDLGLLRATPGYASGILIGGLYFTGFTGVFLVLSVYLQDGLGLSALHAGLLLTPFAVGSAVASPLAGRLVSRVGRPLTVAALLVMMAGLVGVAPRRAGGEPLRPRSGSRWRCRCSSPASAAVPSSRRTSPSRSRRCRPGWAARPAGRCRPVSGSGPPSVRRCIMTAYQVALSQSVTPGTRAAVGARGVVRAARHRVVGGRVVLAARARPLGGRLSRRHVDPDRQQRQEQLDDRTDEQRRRRRVPTPTTPPRRKPSATTVTSREVRTRRIERPVRRARPVIRPSRGPGPSWLPM